MRVSCEPGDPGNTLARRMNFAVFLDGEYVPNCVTADSEAGLVRFLAEGQSGRRRFDCEGGRWEIHERRGRVEIRPCPGRPSKTRH